MPTPLKAILRSASQVAKQNLTSEFSCPACGERHRLIKWGFYTRYLLDGDDTIGIQRVRYLISDKVQDIDDPTHDSFKLISSRQNLPKGGIR